MKFWQNDTQAKAMLIYIIFLIITCCALLALLSISIADIYLKLLLTPLFLSIVYLFVKIGKDGNFNRIIITDEGIKLNEFFKSTFYSWSDFKKCVLSGRDYAGTYRLIIKDESNFNTDSIYIQKTDKINGEIERHIEVSRTIKSIREPLIYRSWVKILISFAVATLIFDYLLIIVSFMEANENGTIFIDLNSAVSWIALFGISAMVIFIMFLFIREHKSEFNSRGVLLYFFGKSKSITSPISYLWNEIEKVEYIEKKILLGKLCEFKIYLKENDISMDGYVTVEASEQMKKDFKIYYSDNDLKL